MLVDAKGAPRYTTGEEDARIHPFDYIEQLLTWGSSLVLSLAGCIRRANGRQPASIDLGKLHAAGCFPHSWPVPLSLEGVQAANRQTAAAATADPEAMIEEALERSGQVSRHARPAAEHPLQDDSPAPKPNPRPLAQPLPPPQQPQPRHQPQAPMAAEGTHRVDAATWRRDGDGWWRRVLTQTGLTRRLGIQGISTAPAAL